MSLFSIAGLHFQFNNYPSDSRCEAKKVGFMMSLIHQSINDNRGFIRVCGLFKLEKVGSFIITAAQDIIQALQTTVTRV